ncbi:MAG: DUF4384 domain-containing protein [Marinibacterium sp.]
MLPEIASVAQPDLADSADPLAAPNLALAAADTPGAEILASAPAFSGLTASAPERPNLPDSAPRPSPVSDLPPPALPLRTDVPAPSVIDPQRPAFALTKSAQAPRDAVAALAPELAGLNASAIAADTLDAKLPEPSTVLPKGPAGQPAIAAAVLPDPAASAQPARAEAQSATPSVREAAPARGQASALVAGAARLDAAPAISVTPRPAAPDQPRSAPLPPAPVEATAMTAALAFSGGDGDIDPVSVAAFQSFVAPLSDGGAASNPVRDGLARLLAAQPCSRLQLVFDPDTASLRVDGHIPEDGLRTGILSALRSELGADIPVSDNMLLLPRPQCGALAEMSDIGLPQSTDQITNPLLLGDTLQARVLDFVAGELIYFDLTAPDYPAYIYVDYFDADGNVLHISPNDSVDLMFAEAKSNVRVGAASADETEALRLFVQAPFGQEITVAFAASAPLYDGFRPLVEPAAAYLDWLRERIADARASIPDFKGEWVYFFVTTAAE